MRPLRIAITGLSAGDNPGPGPGVARSLRAAGERVGRIVGLAYDALEAGCFAPGLLDAVHLLPYPGDDGEAYAAALIEACRCEAIDVLLPNLDAELPAVIRYRERIEAAGIALALPDAARFALRGKDRLANLAERIGLVAPPTEVVTAFDQLPRALERVGWPAWIKGVFYEAERALGPAAAEAAAARLCATWGWPLIVQGEVAGDHLNLVGVAADGRLLGCAAMRKLATTTAGKVWAGVTIDHDQLRLAAMRFARETGWRGPFELECVQAGGELLLLEVNPRFPAWCHLATRCGANLPLAAVDLATTGHAAPQPDCPPGKLLIRYTEELVTDIDRLHDLIATGAAGAA